MTYFEIVMSVLTAVYVGATIFYAITSHKTLVAIEKQGADNATQFAQQLAEATKSANAAKDSALATLKGVRVQEVLHRQWIDFIKWEVKGHTARDVAAAIDKTQLSILFGCEIVNPTSMPLTITRFELTALERTYTAAFESFLIPQSSVPQPFRIIVSTVEQVRDYWGNQLDFDFLGIVTYRDAFDEVRKQRFAFHCVCGPTGGKIDVLRNIHSTVENT